MSNALHHLCAEATRILRADAKANGVPKRGGTHVTFDGDGGSSTYVRVYDDYVGLLHRNSKEFQDVPHWKESRDVWASVRKSGQIERNADGDLLGLISDLVQRYGLKSTPQQVRAIAARHLDMWRTGELTAQRDSVLVGLVPGVRRCVLGPDAEITLLGVKRLTAFWNEDAANFSLIGAGNAHLHILSAKYLLTVRAQVERDVTPELFIRSLTTTEAAVAALRLALVGCIGVAVTRERFVPKPSFNSGSCLNDPPPSLATRASARDVVLDSSAARKSRMLYQRLQKGVPPGFGLAMRRFVLSFERRQPEDAIVDLTIALEATLLHKQNAELTYRIQILGAALLRRNGPEVARKLKQLYSVRSKLVHGACLLSEVVKDRQPNEFVGEMRELVAAVLRAYLARLTHQKSMDDVVKELEEYVVNAMTGEAI